MAFSIFTMLYNPHLYLVPKHFSHPQMKPCTHEAVTTILPAPAPGNH